MLQNAAKEQRVLSSAAHTQKIYSFGRKIILWTDLAAFVMYMYMYMYTSMNNFLCSNFIFIFLWLSLKSCKSTPVAYIDS